MDEQNTWELIVILFLLKSKQKDISISFGNLRRGNQIVFHRLCIKKQTKFQKYFNLNWWYAKYNLSYEKRNCLNLNQFALNAMAKLTTFSWAG